MVPVAAVQRFKSGWIAIAKCDQQANVVLKARLRVIHPEITLPQQRKRKNCFVFALQRTPKRPKNQPKRGKNPNWCAFFIIKFG
jgi:hypothetical protein